MALHLDLDPGDTVRIGGNTVIKVEKKSGARVRIRIDSEYPIKMDRGDGQPQKPDASWKDKPPPLRR